MPPRAPVLLPRLSPPAAEAPDAAWRRRRRREDRAESLLFAPWRRGLHPAAWVGEPRDAALLERAAASAHGDAALKRGERSTVTALSAGASGEAALVLKHYLPTRRADPRDAAGRSKALRSLLAARALQRRGFTVAEPLGCWSRPGAGSWLLLRALPAHQPLHRAILRRDAAAREKLLAALAREVARLHGAGVAYRDLKPSNVLVGDDPPLAFIDHDRNRFSLFRVPLRVARRDLAALQAGLPPELRAAERARALRAYDPALLERAGWRRHVRPLLTEAARREGRWIARRLLAGA